jgi:hypothetical protein
LCSTTIELRRSLVWEVLMTARVTIHRST